MRDRLFIVLILVTALALFALVGLQTVTAQEPQPTPTSITEWPSSVATPALSENIPLLATQSTTVTTLAKAREYLQVPFSVPGNIGVYTNQVYSGTITVSVSGGGQSAGIAYNDAFYLYIDQYGQEISPAQYVHPFYLYIDNVPAIDMIGDRPVYRNEDHIYTFAIDAGPTPRYLNFAIGDVYTVDNDGSFTIALSDSESFTLSDSDGDGIWDHWETDGIDVDNDGNADYILPAADPSRKDVYLEIDWLQASHHNHRPLTGVVETIREAFEQHDIVLHAEVSQAGIPETSDLTSICLKSHPSQVCPPGKMDFDDFKEQFFAASSTNQAEKEARKFVYHYAVFGHLSYLMKPNEVITNASGVAEVGGNDLLVTLDHPLVAPLRWRTSLKNMQTGTLMHELGHNLGLGHGGGDGNNYKPNYLSVMNWWFQRDGIPSLPAPFEVHHFDYSDEPLPDLDEDHLNENNGIQDGTYYTMYTRPDGSPSGWIAGNSSIDWNNDGTISDSVSANINRLIDHGQVEYDDGRIILRGYNDWDNLQFNFRNDWDWLEGVHLELSYEMDPHTAALMPSSLRKTFLPIILKAK